MRKIKTAILGAGFIGRAHIEAVRRLGYAEVTAIVQSGEQRAKEIAESVNVPKAYGSIMDVLQDKDIDVIHNCTPNYLHYEMNKQILLHGKHLLSEKPLTLTCEEAKELYHLAKERDLVTGINFNYRQFPMVQHLRGMAQDNDLGEIRIVRGNYLQDWLLYDTDYNWRIEPEYGGRARALGDIGSHLFDLAQYVTGFKIAEVMADISTIIPKRYKQRIGQTAFQEGGANDAELVDISTEDYCSVLVKFDNGIKGVFTVSQVTAGSKNALDLHLDGALASGSWNQERSSRLMIGYRDKPNETVFRDPTLVKKEAHPFLHYPGGHEEGWPESLKNTMENFYSAVRDQTPLSNTIASFKDGYQSMLLIEAILKSADSGTWEKVETAE
ncbi:MULTISPECIES: Gfo/Idh/MocA family oxidoreductase [unclassified Paenibacillus]|uniref:Gfo/Idh/MocA family protein n=1 Tax=unclassified Paenibacillus TaxID=185978 RepID=UPI001AE8BA0E|nr:MULTISPECIES: Gfo/Idh/MocA family oxidoreductase [unclassified Paenibacillus]MBP1156795.1 putative dehydrogenase [Paenibacillus sp. PvP091]MBP1172466.1 putative dehydrogenase [Paenibacillus sp. PvR098]MBP2438847.1 putative dehydrogenase [Paenibacillus sp. PvP052]